MTYNVILFAHVIGACVLLGTGVGIAFFMLIANRSRDPGLIAHTAGIVVLADYVFTATAAIAQPITGLLLVNMQGWSLSENWILLSIILYIVIGVFWLPVIWMQKRMRTYAVLAHNEESELPESYHRLFRLWFLFGIPAFFSMLGIIWLMLHKPSF